MKKSIIIILVCMALQLVSFAQTNQYKPVNNVVSLGIKGGVNVPRMLYFRNPSLISLRQSIVFAPTGGLFLDIPINTNVILSPEVVYVQRGMDMTYIHHSRALVHYSISTSYIDLRLPLEWCWEKRPYFQPYVFVGVETGMCLFGQIHLDRKNPGQVFGRFPYKQMRVDMDKTIPVDSANMFMIHAGVFAGAGIRSMVTLGNQDFLLKFNVSFHQGFIDSYSPQEHDKTAQPVNVNAYKVIGVRLPQGLEVCMGVAIPLKPKLKDSCAAFAKDRYRRRGSGRQLFGY